MVWIATCLLVVGLGGCLFEDTRGEHVAPPLPTAEQPEPEPYATAVERLPPEWTEEEKVVGLLMTYCGDCHSCRPAANNCGGMSYIDDMQRLIEEVKVVPGKPEESEIVQSMLDGFMPPGAYGPAPQELIDRVSAFIESLCPSDLLQCEEATDMTE
jgi:hypothetical protein